MAAGEKPHKMLYSMGEVAEMFDVNQSLLRFWEQKFDILRPKKNKKGNRLFTPEDVRNLKVIYHLVKERGMTLAGAEKYMKANRRDIQRDMELAERLQTIRALLAEVRDSLGDAGVLADGVFDDPAPAPQAAEPEPEYAAGTVGITTADETFPTADELMREAIAELERDDEPEDIPDFEAEPELGFEEEEQSGESEPETPAKQTFVEQTLFDF